MQLVPHMVELVVVEQLEREPLVHLQQLEELEQLIQFQGHLYLMLQEDPCQEPLHLQVQLIQVMVVVVIRGALVDQAALVDQV